MGAEAVVIGAGYAGLTAAAILAHNGVEVELLETTGRLGGRATFDRKDGYLVDYGIHANRLASQGAAAAALREVGHEIEFVKMGEGLLWWEGSFVPLPTDVPAILKTGLLSASDKAIMVGDMLRLVLANPVKKADVPLSDVARGADRPRLAPLFKVLAGICLICPDVHTVSAGDFGAFLKRALRAKENVGFPRGGTGQIISALSDRVKGGGTISLNSRVKSIKVEKGQVAEVYVKEEPHKARAYIYAAPLQKLPDLLEGNVPSPFLEKCSSIVPTAGISIDLCLSGKVSDVDGLVVTPDPVTMGQFTSNIDPSTAPEGKQLATFYCPLPLETMEDKAAVETAEKKFRGLLEDMFPGMLGMVEWERVLHMKMVDGFEPRVGQTAKDRPGVAVPGVGNLFLAGDCVSAVGSGGDVAFNSGVEAAGCVLSFLK